MPAKPLLRPALGVFCGTLLAVTLVNAALATAPAPLADESATENTGPWSHRHVPDLAVSEDAKVGRCSIVGTYGHTHSISLAAEKTRPWNFTRWTTLRFWAKADGTNNNLLIMLCSKGLTNRRDAAVSLTAEWKLFELPLDEMTFCKNAQGDSTFTRIRSIVFYNNNGAESRIWIDGLELAGPREGLPAEAGMIERPTDGSANTLHLVTVDPFPHLEQASAERHQPIPRYDLPPVAFNRENSFSEALVDFDTTRDWQAIVHDANGYMCLSSDQPLRDVPNLKIELVPTGDEPRLMLVPPKPIRIDRDFDIVECWAYGGKQGGSVAFQFRRNDGTLLAVGTDYSDTTDDVNPKSIGQFWNLVRIVLPEQLEAGAELLSIRLAQSRSPRYTDPTFLFHLDQLRVLLLSDCLAEPAPVFENTGPVVDSFPVDPDGACPRTVEPVRTAVEREGDAYHFICTAQSGDQTRYVYVPKTGTLTDLTVLPGDGTTFHPAYGSGPVFEFGAGTYDATSGVGLRADLVSLRLEGDALTVVWRYAVEENSQTISYEFSLRGRTLRVEAESEDRCLTKWHFGHAKGVRAPRVIEVPFMLYCPNVLLTHDLFVTYYSDWYVGNVSMLPCGADAAVEDDVAWYNWRRDQSYSYSKRTDGLRHPFRERFYITASRTFDDVMLTVSNPPSPQRDILKKRLYRMILASAPGIFGRTRKLVDLCDEYGVTDTYVLFHAPLFFRRRAGSEAFCGDMNVSMLHEPEGGDRGLQELFAHMRAKGIRPGYYDGYPARDYTCRNFHYDWTALTSDGGWKRMWRCAGLKPWAFPELANTVYKARAEKFGAQVSYQDGITSWIISDMSEYDHRFPESGTIRGTLKALATGWQRCRENVNGPVFSEGRGSDFFHAGLNDGDYSKLKGYWDDKDCTEDRVRLLLDFRLKKMGSLSAPLGLNIGYAGFAGTNKIHFESWYSREESYAHLHHYLAAEIAFAAIGMLEPYWPIWDDPRTHFDKTMTSYFMIRQLQERTIMEPVVDIRYFDGERLLSTSDALRADVVKHNRVYVRYRNGLEVYVNLNWDDEHWTVADDGETYHLPAGGWYARQGDDFLEFSAILDGGRVDFVDSPGYVYLDGHGQEIEVAGHRTKDQLIVWKTGPRRGERLVFPQP